MRLDHLAAIAEREFGDGSALQSAEGATRLLALIDDFNSLLSALRNGRDEIGAQLHGSTIGQRATSAYRASADFGKRQK